MLIAYCVIALCCGNQEAQTMLMRELQGEWRCIEATENGISNESGKIYCRIEDASIVIFEGGKKIVEKNIKLQGEEHKADLVDQSKPDRVNFGLLKVEGKVLWICVSSLFDANSSNQRPKGFVSRRGEGGVIMLKFEKKIK